MRPLLLSLVLAATAGAQPSGTFVGDTGAALDAYLTDAGFSGAVVAVKDGAVVLRKGYGFADRARGIPNTPATAIQIGSVTKPLTATLVLSLQDRGLLDVTDPLSVYLDGVPADKAGITLHHLLTHTAGFPGAIGGDDEAVGREAYVERAFARPLDRAPGAGYAYSNVGYALLAAVVETVTGQTYDDALQGLLRGVGMERTGYRLPAGVPVARGYDGDRDLGLPTARPWAADGPYWNLRGNGGLLSTADDLLRFHEALQSGALLSDEARRLSVTPHTDEGEGAASYYGYGWALFPAPGGTLVTHNGGDAGSSADLLRFVDDDVALVVLSNSRDVEAFDVSGALAQILFGAEPPPFAPERGEEVPLDRLAGRPEGAAALAFFDAYAAGSEAAVREYVAAYLDDAFQRNADGVVGFFEAVRAEVDGQSLVPSRAVVHRGEGRVELVADLADGRAYTVEVGFDGDGRIAGLQADFAEDGAEAGCPEPRLPDAPIGDRFRALLTLLCDPTAEARRAFVAAHVDPGVVAEVGADALVAGLGRLADDAGGREVVGVTLRSETEGTVALETPDGEVRVSLRLTDAAPHRIAGLDVEAGPAGPEFGGLGDALDHVAAEAEAGRFSGVVLVAHDGEVVAERAYGWADRQRGERVTPDTRFNVGSINKQLTAVAVLQLAERGRLDLDATIGTYLDGFPTAVADAVTVRHLLQHRSGWGHYWGHADFVGREAEVVEIDDFLDLVRTMPLDFEPGAREQYSNAGYEVLGGLVEAASGQRYADYVWAHVLEPAGMTDARTARHGAPGHATPYLGAGYDTPSPTAKAPSAAGGGYATARDLLRLQTALADGRLLGPATLGLLFNGFEPTDGPVEPSVGIAGGAPGINAVWEWDAPSGWSVVVLANREPPAAEALGLPILRAAQAGE